MLAVEKVPIDAVTLPGTGYASRDELLQTLGGYRRLKHAWRVEFRFEPHGAKEDEDEDDDDGEDKAERADADGDIDDGVDAVVEIDDDEEETREDDEIEIVSFAWFLNLAKSLTFFVYWWM